MRHGPRRTTVADSCGFPGKRRRGGNLPPGKFSWVASWAMHPHFLFRLAEKKTGRTRKGYAASVSGKAANGCAVHGPKEKAAWAHSGAVALRAHGGRRIGASADLGLPSGTLSSSARSMLPSRGGRCRPRRGARTHLTSFSFRAFRFATRYPGSRRGRCPHRPFAEAPSTTGQRQRKEELDVSQTSPGWRFPQGQRVSVPDRYVESPAIPRRRQEVCASADRPAEAFFLFGPCTARFSFGKTKREMGGALPSYQHS